MRKLLGFQYVPQRTTVYIYICTCLHLSKGPQSPNHAESLAGSTPHRAPASAGASGVLSHRSDCQQVCPDSAGGKRATKIAQEDAFTGASPAGKSCLDFSAVGSSSGLHFTAEIAWSSWDTGEQNVSLNALQRRWSPLSPQFWQYGKRGRNQQFVWQQWGFAGSYQEVIWCSMSSCESMV